jgi:hypothetical protein
MKEEHDAPNNMGEDEHGGRYSPNVERLLAETRERLKELACINQTTQILKEGKPLEETLQQICLILPRAWQHPEFTVARITYDGKVYRTGNFRETEWSQVQYFQSIDRRKGKIEVFYTRKFPMETEGPFLEEERHLLINLSNLITGFINSEKAKALLRTKEGEQEKRPVPPVKETPSVSRQLLQKFLTKQNIDRDVFHDLMPFKVREILLVANLYDAYNIEEEGRFSEHILGEYYQLNLSSMPRVTGVTTMDEALDQLKKRHFDMVIIMMGVDKNIPVMQSQVLKKEFPYIPVFLLLNNNSDIALFHESPELLHAIDKLFVWNGDSKIFFAMVKHLEDKVNVENDTQVGLVRIILVVEDSAKYYSRYLPMLYTSVMEQTRRNIDDVTTDELYKVLRLRARPKILLASNYEEALVIYHKYKEFMLCLITDVKFELNGQLNEEAGFHLLQTIRGEIKDLPVIVQSSNEANANKAYLLKTTFIDKNSDSLLQEIKSFISHYLGFGNFVFKTRDGREVAVARSIKEFERQIKVIPDDSLVYHSKRNHFSLWFMARGEVQIAKLINPYRTTDFESTERIRAFLLEAIMQYRNEKNKGKVVPFEDSEVLEETNIVSLASGSHGGKGRGVAFINTLIHNFDFSNIIPNIRIRAPKTCIVGTDEFERFLDRNQLAEKLFGERDYEVIRQWFFEGTFSDVFVKRMRKVLRSIEMPIAIRSSGLFEDSRQQPFAGIFETYLLPNNHPEFEERLKQALDAIKLVYASVYSNTARGYVEAINYKIEEEKMAVVIQEVVGHRYGDCFYPHISGVAQSYNYYPFAHMKPEEGFAVAALGLGKYVVEGEKAYRFSPKYPEADINAPKDQYKNSQMYFYAVDLKKKDVDLLEGDTAGLARLGIDVAEVHGTLKHLASVYDLDQETIHPGLNRPGPRIINFANVLKYNYAPMAKTIEVVLDIVKEALGSPVEIEFAIDLNKDNNYRASFYLLQIKPLIGNLSDYSIDLDDVDMSELLLYSEKGMGNGMIDDVYDLIYVPPETFDKSHTETMVSEINALNKEMVEEGRKYVLIGPGRWGTRDKWIGIPVEWSQISNARVIVETSLEGFPLDASSGSHFFHNVTSMNVGYFSVVEGIGKNFIRWEKLDALPETTRTKYFRHVRSEKPFLIKMDGRQRIATVGL